MLARQALIMMAAIEMMRSCFHFVPITIGLFGIGEVLANAAERYKVQIEDVTRAARLGLHDITAGARAVFSNIGLASGSAVLGFVTGILPP